VGGFVNIWKQSCIYIFELVRLARGPDLKINVLEGVWQDRETLPYHKSVLESEDGTVCICN